MTVYTPDTVKGATWVCKRCGRYNKSRTELHETHVNDNAHGCVCAPRIGEWDSLAESSTLQKDSDGRVVDFHCYWSWR